MTARPQAAIEVHRGGVESLPAVPADEGPQSIVDLLRAAVDKGTPVETMEKLVALHERVSAGLAAKEFARAMMAFQAECPPIKRSSTAKIVTSKGSNYSYSYAELDEIAATVNPLLAKQGLSYSWDSEVEGVTITCICTVRHINGHSITSKLKLPVENPSAMNPQQKVGAALTFAQRRSLSSALGLTTTDVDTDAAQVDNTPVTEEQAATLQAMIEEIPEAKGKRERFSKRLLKWLEVESISTIKATDYQRVVAKIKEGQQTGDAA